MHDKRCQHGFISILTFVISVILFYSILMLCGITCPIKFLTGISCPGCGMTRACLAAIHFEFKEAFLYHPLWPFLMPVLIFLFNFRYSNKSKAFYVLLLSSAALMIVTFLIRMIGRLNTEVVCFEPRSGFIFKLLNNIFNLFFGEVY